jgi:serine/threonine protein kinase
MWIPRSEHGYFATAASTLDLSTAVTQEAAALQRGPYIEHGDGRKSSRGRSGVQPGSAASRVLADAEIVADVYEVGELLGIGGMGQVYEVLDRGSRKRYALKVCHPGIPVDVLEAEVRALEAVVHPGIVRVHQTGKHGDTPFLIMERLYGKTLRALLQEREGPRPAFGRVYSPFPVSRTIKMLARIADALAVLHERGFVHRDLKPSNIMVTRDDRPVLMDLGVSCEAVRAEHEHRMAGSPHYIAPEVITASIAKNLAPCIDIYALGVIGFEMLSGRRPFEQDGQDGLDPLHLQLYAIPPRVSEIAVGVPEPLDELIDEMLRKEADARPTSARAVASRLRAIRPASTTLTMGLPASAQELLRKVRQQSAA